MGLPRDPSVSEHTLTIITQMTWGQHPDEGAEKRLPVRVTGLHQLPCQAACANHSATPDSGLSSLSGSLMSAVIRTSLPSTVKAFWRAI